MRTAQVEIKSCRECPFWKEGPRESTDGFDSGNDWTCSKTGKLIQVFVEWREVNKVEIPEWCPLTSREV